ncbi:MAG: acyl-CoA dehydrogenase family protein [Caulobacterales bacterium]|nr:acyl-CoA dehydrogenase family protein [Caulobacterales bacterium]
MVTTLKRPAADPDLGFGDDQLPEVLRCLREAAPLIREQAPLGEQDRTPTEKVIAIFDELRLWGIMIPRRWGGRGMSTTAMFEITREIGRADMSAAWVVQILNGTGWVASLTSDEIQEEVFAAGIPRVSSGATPPGVAVPVDGGYIVNGAWPYSSGSRQATWGQYGVAIRSEDGTLQHGNFVYLRRSDFEIENTWYTAGLQGTGSDTAVAKDAFVPKHRLVPVEKSFESRDPDRRHFGAPSDYWPVATLIRSTSAGMFVGAAEAMLEMLKAQVAVKPVVTTIHSPASSSQVIQLEIGAAAAKISAARQTLLGATALLDAAALERRVPSLDERARLKGEHAVAFELISAAVEKMMHLAGSSAFMTKNDLQRFWRDIGVGTRHIAFLPHLGYEVYGRSLLGIVPNIIPPGVY